MASMELRVGVGVAFALILGVIIGAVALQEQDPETVQEAGAGGELRGNRMRRESLRDGYNMDTCSHGRTVIVHLFNWKWTDVAEECERFLGPRGYCGVQVSPPNEHLIISKRPWYERYQPVSYLLHSRSGNRSEFVDMVNRCNKVDVRIYVDAVINHMSASGSGTGSGGSSYDTRNKSYPGVPYSEWDFNCCNCRECSTSNCEIHDFNDVNQVRNCRLVGLQDLALGKEYVRGKIADFLNDLINIGVAGFRIDACKHMWPGDIEAVYDKLVHLNRTWFPDRTLPFFFNEVIGGGPIPASHYAHLGRVTEFKYGKEIGRAFRREYTLNNLRSIGETWGMLHDDRALVFVDNHDNQRGHGGGGSILTFHQPREYKMATAFMLAHSYGFTRIMSSYEWMGHDNSQGPPSYANGTIKDVTFDNNGQCLDGWVCEHRWSVMEAMTKFRNVAGHAPIENWFDNGGHQIAFSRGSEAFIAINNEVVADLQRNLQTGMPAGTYCDVISGQVKDGQCSGRSVRVNDDGTAFVYVSSVSGEPILAIHSDSKLPVSYNSVPAKEREEAATHAGSFEGYHQTVVMVHYRSLYGQDLFIRGGADTSQRGCSEESASSQCSIDIRYAPITDTAHFAKFKAWSEGDSRLDWHGAEPGQGSYHDQSAMGSPAVWTTNEAAHVAYNARNGYGPNMWLWSVQMNCTQTENGWFEFKSFVTNLASNDGWESDVTQFETCTGDVSSGSRKPRDSSNHLALCGHVNVFDFGRPDCRIDQL